MTFIVPVPWKEDPRKGYVTQMNHVVGKRPDELAESLGYAAHALSDGYFLCLLIDRVSSAQFQWKDRTRYSGGWVRQLCEYQVGTEWRAEDAYIQRYDQVRSAMHIKERNRPVDQSIDQAMQLQLRLLNVLRGPQRIVKIIPNKKLGKDDYPDAPGDGIPQWELMVEKRFICATFLAPGKSVPAGMYNDSYSR